MFEKLAKPVAKKAKSTSAPEMPQTLAFLACVRDKGYRLSYGGFAQAARNLGEDSSTQILGQRGAFLVKKIPADLQPYVCQKGGGYSKGVTWEVETPADLRDRPLITEETVADAITTWQKAVKKAAAKKATKES